MPRDVDGTFSALYDFEADAAASPPVEFSAVRFKELFDDFADGLNDLPTRSQIVQFIADYNTDPTTLNQGDFTVNGSGVWKVVKEVASVKTWVDITTGSPLDLSGYALNAHDLAAVEGLSTNGLATRTATDTWTTRSIAVSGNGIAVTNGDGVSGNPTLALNHDLAALEALAGTDTLYYRSGVDTWTAVTFGNGVQFSGGAITAKLGANLSFDGSGNIAAPTGNSGTVTSVSLTAPAAGITSSGGPVTSSGGFTLALANDLAALEALSGTNTIYYRSGSDTWTAVTIGSGLTFSGGTLSNSSPDTGTPPSLADQATQELASSQTTYVSPGTQKYHPLHSKAWGSFTAASGTPTIVASSGISSITNISSGLYEVTLTTAMSSTAYAVVVSHNKTDTGTQCTAICTSKTTSTFRIRTFNTTDGSNVPNSGADFVVFGDL